MAGTNPLAVAPRLEDVVPPSALVQAAPTPGNERAKRNGDIRGPHSEDGSKIGLPLYTHLAVVDGVRSVQVDAAGAVRRHGLLRLPQQQSLPERLHGRVARLADAHPVVVALKQRKEEHGTRQGVRMCCRKPRDTILRRLPAKSMCIWGSLLRGSATRITPFGMPPTFLHHWLVLLHTTHTPVDGVARWHHGSSPVRPDAVVAHSSPAVSAVAAVFGLRSASGWDDLLYARSAQRAPAKNKPRQSKSTSEAVYTYPPRALEVILQWREAANPSYVAVPTPSSPDSLRSNPIV